MTKIRITPARTTFYAAVLAALTFGTGQAFARSYPIGPGEYCFSREDFQNCYEGCVALYGPNTQSTCAGAPGLLVCECFP